MIVYPTIVSLFLLVHLCTANRRPNHPQDVPISENSKSADASFPSKPKNKNPTHISDFTDPDTGLNPFLDLQEGRAGDGVGRRVIDRVDDQPSPTVLEGDLHIVEGGSDDRRGGHRSSPFDSRWGKQPDFDNTEKPFSNEWMLFGPDKNFKKIVRHQGSGSSDENKEDVTATPDFDYPILPTENPQKIAIVDNDYVNYDATETLDIQTLAPQPKTSSSSTNIFISALTTGIVVALFTFIVAFCWWRQRNKRTTTNISRTINDIESNKKCDSSCPDVQNGNNSLLKK